MARDRRDPGVGGSNPPSDIFRTRITPLKQLPSSPLPPFSPPTRRPSTSGAPGRGRSAAARGAAASAPLSPAPSVPAPRANPNSPEDLSRHHHRADLSFCPMGGEGSRLPGEPGRETPKSLSGRHAVAGSGPMRSMTAVSRRVPEGIEDLRGTPPRPGKERGAGDHTPARRPESLSLLRRTPRQPTSSSGLLPSAPEKATVVCEMSRNL